MRVFLLHFKYLFGVSLLVGMVGCQHIYYQPSPRLFYDPMQFGYTPEPQVVETMDGEKLSAWIFRAKNPKGVVLQFHGNAENMSSHFMGVAWLSRLGFDVITFDYRGYGMSSGSASPLGLREDAKSMIRFASDYCGSCPGVIIYGQSLGGNVALRGVADTQDASKVKRVVIESSFYSYRHVGADVLQRRWWLWPLSFLAYVLVSDQDGVEGHEARLEGFPKLIVHSRLDPVVSFSQGEELAEKLPLPKEIFWLDEGFHIDSFFVGRGKHRSRLLEFISLDNT